MPLTEDSIKQRFTTIRELARISKGQLEPKDQLTVDIGMELLDVLENFFVDINLIAFCLKHLAVNSGFPPDSVAGAFPR